MCCRIQEEPDRPGVNALLHSLSKRIKGLEVIRDEGGNYYIKTRGKKMVMVKAVKALGGDRVALDLYHDA